MEILIKLLYSSLFYSCKKKSRMPASNLFQLSTLPMNPKLHPVLSPTCPLSFPFSNKSRTLPTAFSFGELVCFVLLSSLINMPSISLLIINNRYQDLKKIFIFSSFFSILTLLLGILSHHNWSKFLLFEI